VTARGLGLLAGCVLLAVTGVATAGPFDGRWAADAPACTSETGAGARLVVDMLSLRWRDAACVVRSSYRVRESWYISARCFADGATASVPITLTLRGERLALEWAGAPAEELKRCP
jgi:hypothetical protein